MRGFMDAQHPGVAGGHDPRSIDRAVVAALLTTLGPATLPASKRTPQDSERVLT